MLITSRKVWGKYVRFANRGEGLAEGFEHGGDHEISTQLDGIGLRRLGPNDKRLASDGVEQGPAVLDELQRTSGNYEEILACGGFRAAENGDTQVPLPAPTVFGSETSGQCNADGAARNVNRALRECGGDAVFAEDDLFNRAVVGEHGHDGLRHATDIGRRIGCAGAIGKQGLRLVAAAVEDGDRVAGAKQVARHAGTHTTESDETNFHNR
jgi:hypothetical protein